MAVLFGRLCVAPLLTRPAAVHPALELDPGFSDRLIDLREDGFDLVILNRPIGSGFGLTVRRIAHERTKVFASPAHLEKHGVPDTVDDLARDRRSPTGETIGSSAGCFHEKARWMRRASRRDFAPTISTPVAIDALLSEMPAIGDA